MRMELQDFYAGRAFDAYTFFGAHPKTGGARFAVWAPSARRVQVEGPFGTAALTQTHPGVWEGEVPGAEPGMPYQYLVTGADGWTVGHCDPYGFAMTLRPEGHSILAQMPGGFTDDDWMAARTKGFDRPMNIYEVHAGSWKRKPDGSWYSYAELAELLPAYCRENGYTHLELMPLAEHPFDGSWGYQVTGFFAPTSRYGSPAELVRFIDACHRQGIGVILDFVPVHFAVDGYGLKNFDGTPLYEDPSQGAGQSEWGSCNFHHARGEVRSFLQSCADYWLGVFHADGLRVDAVSRLIYRQGDPAQGLNQPGLEFLRFMNEGLQRRHPTALLIAEDSSAYPQVTAPVARGGLGFDYKWDLGWMNDTLDYFRKSSDERKTNLDRLTFSMLYAWNERFILPFSHDENVHGKATIAQKMYGGYDGKFPQARALYLYMAVHPGKKLDFMGNEFAQLREWDENREQDWMILSFPNHDAFRYFRALLHRLYLDNEALWAREYDPEAFRWADCDHGARNVCAMVRRGWQSMVLAVFNFGAEEQPAYTLDLPAGRWTLLLDTDWQCWGGTTVQQNQKKTGTISRRRPFTVALPPYSGRLYRLEPKQ